MPQLRVLVVQHEPAAGPGFLTQWLRGAGLRLDVVHPYRGRSLPEQATADGLVVLGGSMGASDDDKAPWLPEVRRLLAQAVDSGIPTFGICLGGQLLAMACGGVVAQGGNGPEIGITPLTIHPQAHADPLFRGLATGAPALQWHQDEIRELPPGATLLAGTAAYPHQAYRLGDRAWGVQFHPEATSGIVRAWAAEHKPALAAAGIDPAAVVAAIAEHERLLATTWQPLAHRFAAVVRESASGPSRRSRSKGLPHVGQP
ncbi:type 1 glutamine amidotransferase [Streptomyces sp. NPDC005202]|uniref:type 1 glutamine amidotransferase n=1 Tax=Streptomyces sp. NPDC005202 TaxID=3157021 RepID=UPI0033A517F5